MDTQNLRRALCLGPVVALALVAALASTTLATAPVGFHGTPLARGTFAGPINLDTGAVEFETEGSTDFATSTVTFDAPAFVRVAHPPGSGPGHRPVGQPDAVRPSVCRDRPRRRYLVRGVGRPAAARAQREHHDACGRLCHVCGAHRHAGHRSAHRLDEPRLRAGVARPSPPPHRFPPPPHGALLSWRAPSVCAGAGRRSEARRGTIAGVKSWRLASLLVVLLALLPGQAAAGSVTLIGAGDISRCDDDHDQGTADVIAGDGLRDQRLHAG